MSGPRITTALWHACLHTLARARSYLRRPYVHGLALGSRRRSERYEDELCLVVTIDGKLPGEAINGAGRRAFPPAIPIRVGRRRYDLPIDVQQVHATLGRLHGIPADRVMRHGQHRGTAGLLVRKDDQRYVVTAGHVARPFMGQILRLAASGIDARVDEVRWTHHVDVALLRVDTPLPAQAGHLPNQAVLATSAHPIVPSLRDKPCFLFRAGQTTPVSTIIRDPTASAPFYAPGHPLADPKTGKLMMNGLISTDVCTDEGDSGALLFDGAFRPVGTLVGGWGGKDYFCPCAPIFAYWDLRPIQH